MTIAQTILDQLGGNRFALMTGLCHAVCGDRSLQFRFKHGRKTNSCQIVLEADDTYTVRFYSIRGIDALPRGEYFGVYCDQLVPLFERVTGLATSL